MATIKELSDGGPDGTRLGQDASDKVSFYGASPTTQPTSASQAAVATTASTTTTPYGYTTSAQADGVITLLNQIRADLVAVGLIKGS